MQAVDSYAIVDLNTLQSDGVIECPYCNKGKSYSYGAKGKQSIPCQVCHRMVLWDYDKMTGYRATAKRFAS